MSRLNLRLLLVFALLAAQSAQAITNQCDTGVPDGYNYQTMIHRTGWNQADYFSVLSRYVNSPEVIPHVRLRTRYFFDNVAGPPVPERIFPMTQYGPLPQVREWVLPDPPQNVRILLFGDLSSGTILDNQEGGGPIYYTHASAGTCGASFTFTPREISEAVLTSVAPANPSAAGRPANSFSVTPAVTSSLLGTSDGRKTLSWVCKKSDGTILTNATFELSSHLATPGSGGHIHEAGRPKGTFSALTGSAGAGGVWTVGYTAAEIGGTETFRARCSAPNYWANPSTWTAYIEIPGLYSLPANPQIYGLVGQIAGAHTDNHFGTPEFNNVLVRFAFDFASKFPGLVIQYNDMSLPYGGLFDIEAPSPWSTPHKSHRFGVDVDVSHRNLNEEKFNYVRRKAKNFKMIFVREGLPHSHLRLNSSE